MDWNVFGHEWAAHLLQQQIARGEAWHAYLFTGPPGVGRRTLALRFAQALNCRQPPEPGGFCGNCRTCTQFERKLHPDLSVVQAESEGGVLKVEQIRTLQHSLALMPFEARFRIGLLLRFQEATASSQNALLKTLEEAPAQVVLLLTADASEAVLPTISSRCEVLRLRPLPIQTLEKVLQESRKLPAHEAHLLAHLSSGRLGYAWNLHEHKAEMGKRVALIKDLLVLLESNRRERFRYADRNYKEKERDVFRQALQAWLPLWRDILLCAAGAKTPLINIDFEADVRRLAAQIDVATGRSCVAAIEQTLLRLDANVNTLLLAEVLFLDWPKIK